MALCVPLSPTDQPRLPTPRSGLKMAGIHRNLIKADHLRENHLFTEDLGKGNAGTVRQRDVTQRDAKCQYQEGVRSTQLRKKPVSSVTEIHSLLKPSLHPRQKSGARKTVYPKRGTPKTNEFPSVQKIDASWVLKVDCKTPA